MVAHVRSGYLHTPLSIGGVRYLCGQPVSKLPLSDEDFDFYKRSGYINEKMPANAHADFRHLADGKPVDPLRTTDFPARNPQPVSQPATEPEETGDDDSETETEPTPAGQPSQAAANFDERQRRAAERMGAGKKGGR